MFLLYSPLNQGLKQYIDKKERIDPLWFLLYSPLNQGLKLFLKDFGDYVVGKVFTLQSIKSRIETSIGQSSKKPLLGFYSTVH